MDTTMNTTKGIIETTIRNEVRCANEGILDGVKGFVTRYREPLIGYASAEDPMFAELKQVAHSGHLMPSELLPGAESVVVFFLPFHRDVVVANRRLPAHKVAREWAVAYIETNSLIARICSALKSALETLGVRSSFMAPTHNFDETHLVSPWSHKHVAYVAGLGTFGVNHMLITEAGCAGRFGSLVVDVPISIETERESIRKCGSVLEGFCAAKAGAECADCVSNCPVGALSKDALDKTRCYEWLLQVDKTFPDLGLCDVCGKCAVGRCALQAALIASSA